MTYVSVTSLISYRGLIDFQEKKVSKLCLLHLLSRKAGSNVFLRVDHFSEGTSCLGKQIVSFTPYKQCQKKHPCALCPLKRLYVIYHLAASSMHSISCLTKLFGTNLSTSSFNSKASSKII